MTFEVRTINLLDILTALVIIPKIGSGSRPAFFNIKSNEPPF
jgi:hypothetical protein